MQETLDRPVEIQKPVLRACAHCGLPTYTRTVETRVFCCHGCMGAYAMIHELGLEDFYALRGNSLPTPSQASLNKGAILDDLDAAGVQVNPLNNGLCSVRLSVDGLHCAACSWLIERIQPTIKGLESAQVRMSDQSVELIYDPTVTSPAHVSRKLSTLGYSLTPWVSDEHDDRMFLQQQRSHWMGIALAAFFAANAMWIGVALYAGEATGMTRAHEYFLRWVGTVLAVMAVCFPGRIFFQTAWQAIQTRTPHIDIPVAFSLLIGTLGTLAGAVSGAGQVYFDSLASLILLLRIGRYIQFRAQYRASSWVGQLLRMNSVVATRVELDGTHKTIPANRLRKGDKVLVQPSETVPADGFAVSNTVGTITTIDMSLVNGESTPVQIQDGDAVVGGTTNLTSPLLLLVTAVGEDSRVGKLMEVVRQATTHRTPWIQSADRVSRWFVIAVLCLSVGTWVGWSIAAGFSIATQHTMALLTIACPCALALAAPLVLTVAIGRAAKEQIWIRDGNCLEKLAQPGTIWLDKTGTLTYGRMTVLDWYGDTPSLAYAAELERQIHHPIAIAVQDFAREQLPTPSAISQDAYQTQEQISEIEQVNGMGLRGRVTERFVCVGNEAWMSENSIEIDPKWMRYQADILAHGRTAVWVAIDGVVTGILGIGDSLRNDAVQTLRDISAEGWRIGILSGDRQEIVDTLAQDLRRESIAVFCALGNQLPEQKLEMIRQSKAEQHGSCVMVGDGVNDAAAMALADVGIAIRGGSEQALYAAPIFLANQRLSSVVQLIRSSSNVVRGIQRCFAASLLYNTFTIGLAVCGWIHPLIAAILMPISGVTVLTMAITTKSFQKSRQ